MNATPNAELSQEAQDMLARWRFRSACADTREWLVVEDFRRVRIIERESWFGKHVERIEPDPAFQH